MPSNNNEIVVEFGRVIKERSVYSAGSRYYKDNIVEYRGAAYIADPATPDGYVTVVPWTTDRTSLNTGWRVFADGNPEYIEEVAEENIRQVNEAIAAYTPVVIEGDVTNAADEEDLTSINIGGTDVIRLKDKAYVPAAYSGLGRVYLRKNIVNGVNVLTQDMLYKGEVGSRVPNTNTLYVIQYDFTLGEDITVPENCVLKFDGGSLSNGKIVIGSNTSIIGHKETNRNLTIEISDGATNVCIDNIGLLSDTHTPRAITAYASTGYYRVYNTTVKNCTISGYLCGIKINGTNLSITDNLLYNNGNTPIESGYMDIHAGHVTGGDRNQVVNPNIIVSKNKCLSNKVHRNIDCGEMYGETNILITDNICVTMTDDGKTEKPVSSGDDPTTSKRDCIMVGYVGVSENNRKDVTITGNVCKYSCWSGIYIRANNTKETENTTKYIANISNNTIVGIIRPNPLPSGYGYHGAIGCEIMSGSIINGNIIRDCTGGIDLGNIFGKGEVLVSNNTINTISTGIFVDSYAEKLNIKNNEINSEIGNGISISSISSASYDYESYSSIDYNIIRTKVTAISFIGTFNNYKSTHICGNIIKLNENTETIIGIDLGGFNPKNAVVNDNIITGFGATAAKGLGIRIFTTRRAHGVIMRDNVLCNIKTGIAMVNGGSNYLCAENNVYTDCGTMFNADCFCSGTFKANGTIEASCNVIDWINQSKIFKVGDVLINNAKDAVRSVFQSVSAVCTKDTTVTEGTPVIRSAKWDIVGLKAYNLAMAKTTLYTGNINPGQECYCIDENEYIVWTGSKWVDRITGQDV